MEKPLYLYHGSSHKITGPLQPVLRQDSPEHIHTKPAVFATARADIAALFMFPLTTLASVGFEQDTAYICIWGKPEEFAAKDSGGFLYVLPGENFEKIGKEYEWQSFQEVTPLEIRQFKSVVNGMIELGVQVYFIDDNPTFDKIVTNKNNRAPILKTLISENQKQNLNVKSFN